MARPRLYPTHEAMLAAKRERQNRTRAERQAAGLCPYCGGKRSGFVGCPDCRLERRFAVAVYRLRRTA